MSELAEAISAPLPDHAGEDMIVTGAATLARARSGDVCFVPSGEFPAPFFETAASAIICAENQVKHLPKQCVALVVDDPPAAFAKVAALLHPPARRPTLFGGTDGISPAATVHPSAYLGGDVTVEAGAVIGPRAQLGSGTRVGPGVAIGPDCRIGRDCTFAAGVTVQHALIGNRVILHPGARIGQDGFGYVNRGAGPSKIVQIGRVIVQDDVEIGANTTIDRGALDDTVVGEGTKIDNLVHISHNVRIGRSCSIAGQAGLSGSVSIGDGVAIGSGTVVNKNVSIGDNATITEMSAVAVDVPAEAAWGGVPAIPVRSHLKDAAKLNATASDEEGMKKGSANE